MFDPFEDFETAGQEKETMRAKPGEVMGLFAYGHPFLDGNGERRIWQVSALKALRADPWPKARAMSALESGGTLQQVALTPYGTSRPFLFLQWQR